MRKKHQRSNGRARSNAKNAVKLWFMMRRENNVNRYSAVDGKPVVVAHEFNAKTPKRPKIAQWRKRLTGELDGDGDPIYEYVTIDVALTARGTESRPSAVGGNLPTGPSSGYAGEQERYRHNAHLEFINKAMLHVSRVCPESYAALEMDAAGYPTEDVAEELNCGRDLAREYVEIGIYLLVSVFFLRPWSIGDGN